MKRLKVEFTKDGKVFDASQVEAVLQEVEAPSDSGVRAPSDVLVLSHGWNNNMKEAENLYEELLGNIDNLLAVRESDKAPAPLVGLRGRDFIAVEIYWPSKKFEDADLIPGGGAASATAESDAALSRALEGLAEDPVRLGGDERSDGRSKACSRAKELAPRLENDATARAEFLDLVRGLFESAGATKDDGSAAFFEADPEKLFQDCGEAVAAPAAPMLGGAAALDGGGAAGLGDLVSGAKAAARRIANFGTYFTMKERARKVGGVGVGPLIISIRATNPGAKIHLVGHSFGGMVVTSAANALEKETDGTTLTLLQAAISHNCLSGDFGNGKAGSFRAILSERRIAGPVVITHTKNDRAVGVAYPLASRIAGQNAAAFGDAGDPYGGMGRNGAQHTSEADGNNGVMGEVGCSYSFIEGGVFNLQSDEFIKNHGDVANIRVAFAVLAAASAVR